MCGSSFFGFWWLQWLQETWLKERKITKRIYSSVHHGAWQAPFRLKFYAATPLVIRTALFDSQLFFYNSRLREWVASGGCPANLQFLVGTVGFMLAGLVAATVNYPFDRVKGHMMGRAFQASCGPGAGFGDPWAMWGGYLDDQPS